MLLSKIFNIEPLPLIEFHHIYHEKPQILGIKFFYLINFSGPVQNYGLLDHLEYIMEGMGEVLGQKLNRNIACPMMTFGLICFALMVKKNYCRFKNFLNL